MVLISRFGSTTNTIFENAGIPAHQIQYTTVGTGAIEVIAGLIGVRTQWLLPKAQP